MQHTEAICHSARLYCNICEGGLFVCSICLGAEGSLPTDCPGVQMTESQSDAVFAGELDFRDGRGWIKPDGTGTSMGDRAIQAEQFRRERSA